MALTGTTTEPVKANSSVKVANATSAAASGRRSASTAR
jgi:hypothetical protein